MSEDIRRIISGKMRDLKDPRIHGGCLLYTSDAADD